MYFFSSYQTPNISQHCDLSENYFFHLQMGGQRATWFMFGKMRTRSSWPKTYPSLAASSLAPMAASTATSSPPPAPTLVSESSCFLLASSPSSWWPSTFPARWPSLYRGCPSGWTTRRCQPGWPWGWPPCWPCPPPRPAYRTPFPLWPTPRPSTSGLESASSSSLVLFLNMPLSTMPPGEPGTN